MGLEPLCKQQLPGLVAGSSMDHLVFCGIFIQTMCKSPEHHWAALLELTGLPGE